MNVNVNVECCENGWNMEFLFDILYILLIISISKCSVSVLIYIYLMRAAFMYSKVLIQSKIYLFHLAYFVIGRFTERMHLKRLAFHLCDIRK